MRTGPDQPQGPRTPAGGYGQGGWPGRAQDGGHGQGQARWPGQEQTQEQTREQTREQAAWQPLPQAHPQPQQWAPGQPGRQPAVVPKNPALSVLLSFFLPGLGSLVSGNPGTGVVILVTWLISGLLTLSVVLLIVGIPVGAAMWIWGMVDAYRSAQRWNRAHGIIS